MPPTNKRKRGGYSHEEDYGNRPSPHRPQNIVYANAQQQINSPRGGRRGSRNSGRGGHNGPQSPSMAQPSPTSMAPPSNPFQPTKPAPPTPTTPATPKEQTSANPDPTAEVPEINTHLTVQRVANWNAENRKSVVQAATEASQQADIDTLSMVFYEINDACLKQYMNPDDLGSLVRDILAVPFGDDTISPVDLFLDSLSTAASLEENPAYQRVRMMLISSELDPHKLRCILESDMLVKLELVRPSFPKVAVRKATNALYRQTNYNLLREESEGFSKLMTEYFTTVNTEDPTREAVSAAYQRVNAFIGAFDLDVGRVLDLTLDVFANLLVKHGKFFVKYLRASSWWPELQGTEGLTWEEPEVQTLPAWALPDAPSSRYSEEERDDQLQRRQSRDVKFWKRVAELSEKKESGGIHAFYELGTRRVIKDSREAKSDPEDPSESRKTPMQKWAEDWINKTGTLPPPGNEIAAQLLGFKLQFYASDTRDASDVLPDNLIYLAALLIKIGFISIVDLYPHLYPEDKDMAAHKNKLMKEKEARDNSRRGKSTNALATAGALSDDTQPAPAPAVVRLRETESRAPSKPESERSTPVKSDDEAKKSALPEPVDQKVALLRSLLCIGALPEALFILGRFPWLLEVYPDLHAYIFRLAHHSLHKIYDASRPVPLDKIPSGPKGANAPPTHSTYVPRRTLRWAKLDQKDAGDGVDYRFYWEDWTDNVPVCQSVDDVFLLCSTLLRLVGPECGRDILLMTKLARIGKKSVTEDGSEANMKRWAELSATFLAPALTFTGQNPGVVNEMWELFKRFDTGVRYCIYQHWFNMTKPPIMRSIFKDITDDTKSLLGRVAATNTRPMGRAMAKLACACPGKVFAQTLKQGQTYINMIDALVECSRYLTNLGYDCLTWTLVNTLVNSNRPTLQEDGMLVKGWLKNTAIFIGKVYGRYSLMDPTPVLQFIRAELFKPHGEMYMLTVLEQLITAMGGIGLGGALTEARILALSAGPALRARTLEHHLGDQRHKAKSPARRFLRCLKDAGLIPQILIALAQQVENYLHREELIDVPDKVVMTNFDHFRANFAQYLDFLRENLSPAEFDAQVPGVVELISEYGLEPSLAFQICRDSLDEVIGAARMQLAAPTVVVNGDTKMGGTEENAVDNNTDESKELAAETSIESAQDTEMKDGSTSEPGQQMDTRAEGPKDTATPPFRPNPEIATISQQLKDAMPDFFQDHPFVDFFVTFWSLSLKDVYNVEGNELKQQYEDARKSINSKAGVSDFDNRYHHVSAIARQAKHDVNKLNDEYQAFSERARAMQAGLQKEMLGWFDNIPTGQSQVMHDAVIQDCFLPRVRVSVQDAQFSSTMLFFMHRTGVPGFRLLKFLDRLFTTSKLNPIITSMSEEEVKSLGRFINDILRELQRWHENENLFERSAYGENKKLRGFAMSADPESPLMTFKDFRHVLCKWHRELYKTLVDLIGTGFYMELRNSINILKAVAPAFPKIDTMAMELRGLIEGYTKDEERGDVSVAANSLLFEFQRSAKFTMTEAAFKGEKEDTRDGAKQGTSAPGSSGKVPIPRTSALAATKLSTTASSFTPKDPDTNGASNTIQNTATQALPEKQAIEDRLPTTTNLATRVNGRDTNTNKLPLPGSGQPNSGIPRDAPRSSGAPQTPTSSSSVPIKPDIRNTSQGLSANRAQHALPSRPDAQPPRARQPERTADRPIDRPTDGLMERPMERPMERSMERPMDRPMDRPTDYHAVHSRHEARPNTPNEYGRPERPVGSLRDRDHTRRYRSRSPVHESMENDRRERHMRDTRDYDDRPLRPSPRDTRASMGRGQGYVDTPRDSRDPQRDYRDREHMRERVDARVDLRNDLRGPSHLGHLPPPDSRSRLHSGSMMSNSDMPHRREQSGPIPRADRNSALPQRPTINSAVSTDQVPINPQRAAFIDEDRTRIDPSRTGRDTRRDDHESRRDRLSHPHDDRSSGQALYANSEMRRDYRDERHSMHPNGRDRRDEMAGPPPTGPRNGRDPTGPPQVSREMFQPSQGPPPRRHQNQDPNYGRLNQPTEPIPSGPRNPASDRRDSQARPPSFRHSLPGPGSAPATPTASTAAQATGVHPSRAHNIKDESPLVNPRGPPVRTDGVNVPSGPRSANRAPYGPASTDQRSTRQDNRSNPVKAINSLLSNNAPTAPSPTSERPEKRSGRERSRSLEHRGEGRSEGRGEERQSREKRDRDGSRRDRDRDRDRNDRERRDAREPRDERDRRSRGERGEEGRERSERKRVREAGDQPHGETKRRR